MDNLGMNWLRRYFSLTDIIKRLEYELKEVKGKYRQLDKIHDELFTEYNELISKNKELEYLYKRNTELINQLDYKDKQIDQLQNYLKNKSYYEQLCELAFQEIDDKNDIIKLLKNKISELNEILIIYNV